jgi:hypothetical protein
MDFQTPDQVFDWAHRLSDRVHKVAEYKEATAMLANHFRCGQCDNWMKSSQCPREVNIKGRNQGPSCKSMPCDKFVESRSAVQQRESLTLKIETLKQDLSTPPQGPAR